MTSAFTRFLLFFVSALAFVAIAMITLLSFVRLSLVGLCREIDDYVDRLFNETFKDW